MSLSQKILDAVDLLTNSSLSKAGYDKTIQAQILSCQDASIGKYRCRYQDSTIYAYSNTLNTSYNKGDYVYILVPSNDMNKEKTILGTSNKIGSNFISKANEQDKYEIVGNNCITSTRKYYLNTVNPSYSYDIYTTTGGINNKITIDTEALKSYLKESNAFKMTCMIKTSIPVERQARGSYGLIFTLTFKDNTLERNIDRTYVFNENSMCGNPYNYKNNTKQTAIFKIDGKNFVEVKKITLFNNSFPGAESSVATTGDLLSGDITISALTLCGLVEIDENNASGVTVSFNTPNGTILNNSIDSLSITAQVKVDGRIVSSNQNLKFYWGIEDVGIAPSSIHYNKYLGGGWRCLNESNSIVTNSTVDWVPNTGTFIYTKAYDDILLTKDNRLRVAVVFNKNTYINELVVHNNTKSSDIILTSDSGTVFYYDKGSPTLTCGISGSSGTYSYQWGQETNTGVFKTITNATNILKVEMGIVTDFVKIKCSVYSSETFKGTAIITLTNSLKEDELSLIEGWNGKTVQINENSILSPRVGAGKKDNDGFTGVVMGVLKQYPDNVDQKEIVEKVGLFGYSNNTRSFFLNSKNGSAIFGAGSGRIAIDPSQNEALIYSSNFWKSDNLNEDGFPKNYEYRYPNDYQNKTLRNKLNIDYTNPQGMLINLTKPEIVYGSGNFSVDEEGRLSASNVNVSGKIVTSSDPDNAIFTSTQLDAGTFSIWYRASGTAATPAPKVFEIVISGTETIKQTCLLADSNNSQGIGIGVPWPDPEVPGTSYIITDYSYNLGQGEIEEDCRHKFIGKIKFFEDPNTARLSPKTPDTTLMEVHGNMSVDGTLQVDSISVTNGIAISGDQTYLGNLTVNGNITSSTGKITANNGLDITGTSILRGSTTLNSTLTVTSSASFNDNVNILGDKSLQWGGKDFIKYITLESNSSNYGLYVGAINEKLFLRGSVITSNVAISTSSDEREKNNINLLDKRYIQLLKEISPVSFKYNSQLDEKFHTGFIAQDVKAAMQKCGISNNQLAAFVDINEDGSEYALRYEEFISPMLLYIKSLEEQIKLLKQKVGI